MSFLLNPYRFAAGVPIDPYWSNVMLLIGANGTDGSTAFVDESGTPKTLTTIGNAQIDTAQAKFGSSSALFDGSGDAITAPDSPDWDLSDANSDQFTIEVWVRFASLSGDQSFVSQWTTTGNLAWHVRKLNTSNEVQFAWSTNGTATGTVVTSGASLAINIWYHIAADKDATGKIRVYINGVMKGSATPADSTIHNPAASLTIGGEGTGLRVVNGWLDEVRITKGVARYASDSGFTVPTAAFPRS